MQSILLIVHILMALALIGLILIQHGKGADAGAAFGGGASSSVFGSAGSTSFLSRATGILAFVFFANSFFLSYLSTTGVEKQSLMQKTELVDEINPNTINTEVIESDIPNMANDDVPVPADQSDMPVVPQ